MSWTREHEVALVEIKKKSMNEIEIKSLLGDIKGDIGMFHTHRDAEFNLLFHASIEDNLPAAKALVELGVDPMRINQKQINVLHLMAKRDQVEMARRCLEAVGEDKAKEFINNSSNIGWSVLIQASNEGKVEFVKWLIDNGANINWTMGSGWTALHAASMNGKNEVVKLLLEKGADKTIKASHRKFNRSDLTAKDVGKDEETKALFG